MEEPVYQLSVQFSTALISQAILCGRLMPDGSLPNVSVQSATVAGRLRPGMFTATAVWPVGGDVYATIVFNPLTFLSGLCAAGASGQINMVADRPFSMSVKFG